MSRALTSLPQHPHLRPQGHMGKLFCYATIHPCSGSVAPDAPVPGSAIPITCSAVLRCPFRFQSVSDGEAVWIHSGELSARRPLKRLNGEFAASGFSHALRPRLSVETMVFQSRKDFPFIKIQV